MICLVQLRYIKRMKWFPLNSVSKQAQLRKVQLIIDDTLNHPVNICLIFIIILANIPSVLFKKSISNKNSFLPKLHLEISYYFVCLYQKQTVSVIKREKE